MAEYNTTLLSPCKEICLLARHYIKHSIHFTIKHQQFNITQSNVHISNNVHTHICTHTYVHTHTYTHTHTHKHTHTHRICFCCAKLLYRMHTFQISIYLIQSRPLSSNSFSDKLTVSVVCVYRPPTSRKNKLTNYIFYDKLQDLMLMYSGSRIDMGVLGNFHVHFNQLKTHCCKINTTRVT